MSCCIRPLQYVLIDSKGQVGIEQRNLIYIQIVMMLLVVVPAIAMSLWFAWKYRHNNKAVEKVSYAEETVQLNLVN